MAALSIDCVSKNFGDQAILKDIQLSIDSGEFLVLVGPSGCGKSTLLNIIAGLEPLTGGTIKIGGRAVEHLEPKERDIAMVFQSYALYPSMTVEKNIAFPLRMRGLSVDEQQDKVREVAELLQIGHLLQRKPQQLSGGQRQRVAMGRALVRNPEIFLFDEPLSNLDAKLRVDMRTEIKRLHQRVRKTTVYVTHDQVEAMTMATRIAVMKDGVVQQFGTPSQIYEQPANTFVATFMGSPAMNLVPAEVLEIDGSKVALQFEGTNVKLELPVRGSGEQKTSAMSTGESVLLGLRPEWFVHAETQHLAPFALSAAVDVLEPTGPDLYAALRIGSHDVMARLPAGAKVNAGSDAWFSIDLSKAVIFSRSSGLRLH